MIDKYFSREELVCRLAFTLVIIDDLEISKYQKPTNFPTLSYSDEGGIDFFKSRESVRYCGVFLGQHRQGFLLETPLQFFQVWPSSENPQSRHSQDIKISLEIF